VPLCAGLNFGTRNIWYSSYIGFIFFIYLGCSLIISRLNKWLALFTVCCLLSSFFVVNLAPRAMLLLNQVYLGCLVAYVISKFKRQHRVTVIAGIVISILIQYAWVVLQSWNIDPLFNSLIHGGKDEAVAFFGAKDQMGAFFAITGPVLFYVHPFLSLLCLAAVILSKSSFAFISLLAGCSIAAWYRSQRIFSLFIFFMLCCAVGYFGQIEKLNRYDFSTRFSVWSEASRAVYNGNLSINKNGKRIVMNTNPAYGYGFASFLNVFPYVESRNNSFNYADEKFTHAHNDYIEVLFELGWIGFSVLVILVITFLWGFITSKKTLELAVYFGAIVAYLCNAMGNFVTHIATSGMLLVALYGLYESTRRELKHGQDAKLVER
jgi:hypothetical protein